MGKCQSKTHVKDGAIRDDKTADSYTNDVRTQMMIPTQTESRTALLPAFAKQTCAQDTFAKEIVNYSSTSCMSTSLDTSGHSSISHRRIDSAGSNQNIKGIKQSSSILGLDQIIDGRKNDGDIRSNVVHIEIPFGKPIEEVYDGIHDGTVLGSGISGMVRLCSHKATGVKYAVKSLDLRLVETDESRQQLREEIAIMCQLDHPNIVRLEEVYESHHEIYLVQELCVGGELFDRLDEQPDYHYTESQCARLVKQMICSVRYIHSKGIIHRDLKLENFLFSTTDQNSELKMIDFGLSKHFNFVGELQHDTVGTPYTVAPEVIRGSYDERCDVWAIGVITYLLLSGEPPFGGCGGPESLMQVRSNILEGHFEFQPEDVWANVSKQAKSFILMLLVTDPNARPTAQTCQEDSWLQEWTQKDKNDNDNNLNPNVVKALVNFKEYSDMRKLLCEVLSFTLLPEQITDLRKEFEKLDTEGSGEISLCGLKEVMLHNAGTGSLGALTETEVEDIFNAMRVRKSETSIHWHEFIAAGLSQCQVDDRNLKLAFERLDHDHKDYVTFDDVMNLMGRDGAEKEDAMKIMWGDSMRFCNSENAQITYQDFLLLMKRQPKEEFSKHPSQGYLHSDELDDINEDLSDSGSEESDCEGVSWGSGSSSDIKEQLPTKRTPLLPTPIYPSSSAKYLFDDDGNMSDASEGPFTMDDEDLDEAISKKADIAMNHKISVNGTSWTPPVSPVSLQSFNNFTPIRTPTTKFINKQERIECPANIPLLSSQGSLSIKRRLRSKSVDDQEEGPAKSCDNVVTISRYSLPLSEHTHNEIDSLIKDETKTPLVVNRKLYRAHRLMRLSVCEASKRFEDQHMERTKAQLQAENDAGISLRLAPGLVMRHGHTKELSSDAIHKLMKEKLSQQQKMIEVANKRGGRGRRTRKKTISDMSGMFGSGPQNDFSPSLSSIPASPPTTLKKKTVAPSITSIAQDAMQLHLHDMSRCEPTIPGVFRETLDPFSHMKNIFESSSLDPVPTGVTSLDSSLHRQSTPNSDSHMKISVSDGELNQHGTAPLSPESCGIDTPKKDDLIGASTTWPAPPQL